LNHTPTISLPSVIEKKHPEDQEIKAIKFFSFCAFDVFSEIKTIQNVYYYGEEDVGDGEMPFLKEMTREEIEKYDKENEFSLIKDPEKLSEIQTKLDNWIKEYENIEDKDWIEIEFMDEYIAPKNLVSEQRPAFSNLIDDFFKQCDENLDCVLIGSRLPCTLVDSINSKFYEKWVQWFADTELTNEERQWNLEFGPNYMCGHSPSLEEVEAVCENNLCQVREK